MTTEPCLSDGTWDQLGSSSWNKRRGPIQDIHHMLGRGAHLMVVMPAHPRFHPRQKRHINTHPSSTKSVVLGSLMARSMEIWRIEIRRRRRIRRQDRRGKRTSHPNPSGRLSFCKGMEAHSPFLGVAIPLRIDGVSLGLYWDGSLSGIFAWRQPMKLQLGLLSSERPHGFRRRSNY